MPARTQLQTGSRQRISFTGVAILPDNSYFDIPHFIDQGLTPETRDLLRIYSGIELMFNECGRAIPFNFPGRLQKLVCFLERVRQINEHLHRIMEHYIPNYIPGIRNHNSHTQIQIILTDTYPSIVTVTSRMIPTDISVDYAIHQADDIRVICRDIRRRLVEIRLDVSRIEGYETENIVTATHTVETVHAPDMGNLYALLNQAHCKAAGNVITGYNAQSERRALTTLYSLNKQKIAYIPTVIQLFKIYLGIEGEDRQKKYFQKTIKELTPETSRDDLVNILDRMNGIR